MEENTQNTDLLMYVDTLLEARGNSLDSLCLDQKIVVMDRQECLFIKVDDICYIEADGAYSNIYLNDGRKLVVSKSVKVFADKLSEKIFCRIHKSYIINLNFISKYVKSHGGHLIMENGASIPISPKKKERILELVKKLSL